MSLDWVAGFFDGEGSVGLWKNNTAKRLRAAIAQNDRKLLDEVVRITGLGRVNGPYKSTNGPNTHYRWSVDDKYVLLLYEQLSGRLLGKQEQFDKAIKEYNEYRASRICKKSKPRGVS